MYNESTKVVLKDHTDIFYAVHPNEDFKNIMDIGRGSLCENRELKYLGIDYK